MSENIIHSLESYSDEQLLQHYSFPQQRWCRFNFVASADGAATLSGHSDGLSSAAEARLMQLLRFNADVVLLGSGTIAAEAFSQELFSAETVRWREAAGLSPYPRIAVLSTSARVGLSHPEFFSSAPEKPLLFTTTSADAEALEQLADIAEVHQGPTPQLSPHRILGTLEKAGLQRVHSEGGPSIFARFIAADVVDQLCLALSPLLVGSGPRRIADAGDHPFTHGPRALKLHQVFGADDMLFLDYRRRR